ncbi:DUF4199 domain-containing protein [Flavobacterium buctense]|uniref:DUF4199 domain-containing protein n=1 Tax=Flavobacterium buctense TaxID=1648146 RepID=A0ABU9E3A4_9FLAO|nr:DUF4199 domain-containing protein [Flavobacterium buctense]
MKKIIITNGLIAGAIVATFMVYGTYKMNQEDFEPSMILGYAGMLIAYVFVFLGIKNYRDNYNNGAITFGKAFKIGMLISLIAATIYVGVWLIEYYCFFPDFMEKYATVMEKNWQKEGLTLAEIKAKTEEMNMFKELYKNPIWVILITYSEILLPIGVLVPIISALILKRQQKIAQ